MTTKRGCVELLNPSSGLMECQDCGQCWIASIRSGGRYYRGSWQCPNGCNRGRS